MKIQSRPPVQEKPVMGKLEMTLYMRNILQTEGYRQNLMYQQVLVKGAAAVLKEMCMISDYAVHTHGGVAGYYNILVDVITPHGEYCTLYL